MKKTVLVLDTSVLCVHLRVPGLETCGPSADRWDGPRVTEKLTEAERLKHTIVVPLATLVEVGNHIANAPGDRFVVAKRLAAVLRSVADDASPWAAFDESRFWDVDALRRYADEWPELAARGLSLADVSISKVAEFYSQLGFSVEILTGDQGLKSLEPAQRGRRGRPSQ